MSLDILGYLETAEIELVYSGENVGANDVATQCPWCDDPSTHLTINRSNGQLNCWRCDFDEYKSNNKNGWRPSFVSLIKEIEKCSWKEAKRIYEEIGGSSGPYISSEDTKEQRKTVEKIVLPSGFLPFDKPGSFANIRDNIFRYLKRRKFGIPEIEKYKLMFCATGYYVGRVIIPYYKNNEIVNWVGRRTSSQSKARYQNCKIDQCIHRLSELVYGEEYFDPSSGILRIVEGAFDKMRIGDTALALSRSQFSGKQRNIILNLSKNIDQISIILDPEAEKRSISIAENLSQSGKKIKIVQLPLKFDPANMTFDQVLYFENRTSFFKY